MICTLCHGDATQSVQVPLYDIQVCEYCWVGAIAGWPTRFEDRLFEALAAAGLLIPDRNSDGLLPRQYTPPADFQL